MSRLLLIGNKMESLSSLSSKTISARDTCMLWCSRPRKRSHARDPAVHSEYRVLRDRGLWRWARSVWVLVRHSSKVRRSQPVGATLAWSLLAGVSKPKVFRGR